MKMKVVIAGTFDIIHPGHIYLFEEASKCGDVYVIIARDKNVEKIKGRKPIFNENERKLMVENIKYVKKAYLGDLDDFFKVIKIIDPDIIFLGPDQNKGWVEKELQRREMRIRLIQLKFRKNYSSSGTIEVLKRLYKEINKEKNKEGEGGDGTPPQNESIPKLGQ